MTPIPYLKDRKFRSYGEVNQNTTPTPSPKRPSFRFNKPKISKNIIKKALLFGILSLATLFIFGTIVVAWISSDLPDPNNLTNRQVAQSTKIYDRTGEHILYEIYQDQKRTTVTMDKISPFVPQAVVAIEDKHFYEHSGIRVTSILRALFNNVIGSRSGSGGASTITQQLIKNAIIGDDPGFINKIIRKIKEVVLAPRLEKKYKKEEILQMYLNEIPFGSTNYGVESAAQTYFHKSAKDLSLAESATLAAMIQAPSKYLNNTNALKDRRDYVIKLMADQGNISEAQKNEAIATPIKLSRSTGILAAPHFVLYVKQLLADQFGEKMVDTGGLKVITTLDFDKQKIAEDVIKEMGDKYAKESNANNAALVSMDPKNGQILAMVGSRDFYNDEINGQFNVAVLGKRQPGSSFKPFVYTFAFEKGYTPQTVLYDTLTNFDMRTGGNYSPKNYDKKEHSLVTMRKALQGSLNIPAVKTLYLVGTKETIDFAKRFGYTTFTGDPGLSLVLGGAEVNLLEHTDAYATLANNGTYNPPASILKVEDYKGNKLYEWKQGNGTEAITPELAATISNVLTDDSARAFMFGRNSTLTLPDRPVAAKTGTTNNYFDAWTMGYIPSLTTGVWVGNTNPSTMKGGGNLLAGSIWNKFMRESLKNTPVEQFPAPPPINTNKPILTGSDGGMVVKINRLNGKIATSSTPEGLITEKTFLPPHDILYYVDKNDPTGPIPSNPADDPQYENWEAALLSWVERERKVGNEISFEEPPTEYDNTVADPTMAPMLEILSPSVNSILNTRQINIQIKATAPRGVAEVVFSIDGFRIGGSQNFPFDFSYYAKTLPKGIHILKVVASDDQGNATIKEINFDLQAEMDPPSIEWFDHSPLSLNKEDFPRTILITPFRWEEIKNIKIYLKSPDKSERLIYTFDHNDKIFNNNLTLNWKNSPGTGTHSLRAEMIDNTRKTTDKRLDVEIK